MAAINIDDAYILDNTGKQVDDAVDYGLFNSNDNLLDNAYFVGGGSQLGDGIFPINQRGQTSYANAGYGIDRWSDAGLSGTTVSLTSSGLTLTSTGNTVFRQNISQERIKGLLGKPVCLSVMDFSGIVYSTTATLPSTMPSTATEAITISLNNANFSLYIGALNAVQFYFFNSSANIGIAAVKLELGTYSTLANDVSPDFGEELRKCQRYLWQETFGGNTQIGCGPAIDASTAIIDVVMPVSMHATPTITFTANVLLVGNGGVVVAGSVIGINVYDNHLRLVVSATGLTAYQVYSYLSTTTTTMTVSAEL